MILDGGGNSSPASNADAFYRRHHGAEPRRRSCSSATPTSDTDACHLWNGEPGALAGGHRSSNGHTICSTTVQSNGELGLARRRAALANGSYTVSAKQTDAAGNTSAASDD